MEASKCRKGLFRKIIKATAFLLILGIALSDLSGVMVNAARSHVEGFYDIPENTSDIVFIGSSRMFEGWIPMEAWNKYGMSTVILAAASLPVRAVRYYIEEARKTQPDAMFVVNVDTFRKLEKIHMYRAFAKIKNSSTRARALLELTPEIGANLAEQLSYWFPLICYHERWDELEEADFFPGKLEYNGTAPGLKDYSNLSGLERVPYAEVQDEKLDENMKNALDELTDYIEENSVRVLFINMPRGGLNRKTAKRAYTSMEYLRSKGYDVIDFQEQTEELGIKFDCDFGDYQHLNIHGALKLSRWLSDYLAENYELTDRRGDARYAYNEESAEALAEKIAPYVADFELTGKRDCTLEKPQGVAVTVSGEDAVLSWKPVEGADGYAVYRRKTSDTPFKLVDTTTETDLTLAGTKDQGTWFVVPYREEDGVKYYGNFDYAGTAA